MKLKLSHTIGATYIYPNDPDNRFKLVKVTGWIYRFKCGHWCTDSVFMDLINVEAGKQGFELIPHYSQIKMDL